MRNNILDDKSDGTKQILSKGTITAGNQLKIQRHNEYCCVCSKPIHVIANAGNSKVTCIQCSQDSSPPEVTATSPCLADSSSNYLSLKSIATPGDRGSGEPGSDLRELEGEVNRRADGRIDNRWKAVCKTRKGPQVGRRMEWWSNLSLCALDVNDKRRAHTKCSQRQARQLHTNGYEISAWTCNICFKLSSSFV